MTSDLDLLGQYARNKAQDAFTEIVRRHVSLVYSAALRQVRSQQLAEEVAQSVFTDLARDAGKLKPDTILTGWLYAVTRRTAIDTIRKESRRQLREQIAMEMNDMNATANDWTQIEPLLDDAIAALDDTDRAAVLLRYFENKSLREVGATLGTSDDTAQKRVSRAVERLREFFSKQNVTIGAGGLVVLISANAVQSAPVGLAVTISTAAVLAGTAVHTSTVIAATKTIAMTTLQKTLITAAFVATAGTGFFEAHKASQLQNQIQTLQQQQAPLAEQIQQLQRERDDAKNQSASLQAENEQLKSKQNTTELLKLRSEVAQLRNEANDPTEKAAKTVAAKVKLLKLRLEQMPDKKIPELQFVTEKDWADAVWNANLDTDDDVREALSKLRETAENIFLNEMMKDAFKKYLAVNNDILPADLSQLKSYFDVPVTDEMLQRYKLLQTGKPDNSADLVSLTTYADEEYDSNHGMSINGAWGGRFNRVQQAVEAAANAFILDNNGQIPNDPSQITTYLKMPIDTATILKYLKQITANPPPPETVTLAPVLKSYSDAHNGQMPQNPSDLLPYLTTPQQQAAFQKLEQNNSTSK
jgi:RNA polymerase sigma factor (sigma-70 family)